MADKKRIPRELTEDEVRRLTNIQPDEVTKQLMIEYFANFEDEDAKFLPQDRFVLQKEVVNKYAQANIQKEDIHTTVGRYMVNLFIIFSNPKFVNKVGYLNYTLDKGKLGKLSNDISSLILTNEITTDEYFDYINRLNWFGFTNSSFTTPSINYDIVKPLPKVMKRKEELLKEHSEALDNGDVKTSALIEKELIELAKQELKDNPATDLYNSGAKVNFGNQYKNMNIMGGAYKNNSTGEYRIITKSLIEGIDKEDISANGDSLVTGVYSRAVGTQKGGLTFLHVHLKIKFSNY